MDGRGPIKPKAYTDMAVTSKDGFVGLMFASEAGTFTVRLAPDTAELLAVRLNASAETARSSRVIGFRRG
jgi:hypothetical protein